MQAYLDCLPTVSVAVTVFGVVALMLKRRLFASLCFLALSFGAMAIVWDDWSARTGHQRELVALVHPVALSSTDVFLLITHAPLFFIGLALLMSKAEASRGADPKRP